MAYTETKTTGYGSRVSSSFKGIGTGFLLFFGATALLWWNEGRAVHRAQDIKEVGKNATHVESIESIAAEGSLIHANGTAKTSDVLSDATFGVSVTGLALDRKVEYYQWEEHSKTETKEKIGGSKEEITTYTYERAWTSSPINSNDFHDPDYKGVNSVLAGCSFENKEYYAENVSFGAYKIPANFIRSVAYCASQSQTALNIAPELLQDLNNQIKKAEPVASQVASALTSEELEYVHVNGSTIYLGKNASNPAIGDVRITFTNRPAEAVISLIAVVQGDSFTEYKTKNGANDRYITAGTKTLDEMMTQAEEENEILTWILRIVGLFLVCAGLKNIFNILVTLLKVLPFLANILNWGVNLICNVIGFAWTLIVIAIAWIFYRPLLGITLLVIAGAAVYYFVWKGKGKTPVAVPAEEPSVPTETK